MSAAVQANVWRAAPCGGSTLLALLALADEANDDGSVDASIASIASKARATERHVRRVVAAIDGIEGVTAVCAAGRVVASLDPYAATPRATDKMSEPATVDKMSNPDILSLPDKMSGHLVTPGQDVRHSPPAAAPPTRVVLSPPVDQEQNQEQTSEANASSVVGATPPQNAGEARKRSGPASPRPATDYGDAFVAVCRACRFDATALPPQVAKLVSGAAKTLLGIKASAAEIDSASSRWYAEDWRGQKGQAPSTAQLITWVSQCRVAAPLNRSRPGSETRAASRPPVERATPEQVQAARDSLAASRARARAEAERQGVRP